ncbi:hypothetical protein HPP92_003058 [Vanilla planifolia]|uniref:Reverse transcriptase domain-containing protein n=1 Tax=Vanilla planifolia TaxID=51239 RepID=A0A835S2W4_VANPL|nr:hypothetical protein HPP92_003058 [Vanilla planifolia]
MEEMLTRLNLRRRHLNVILKLDLKSAFDKVSWSFIKAVLAAMGFSEDFCLIVSNILEATRLSVLLNGQPDGFFSPTCGVRQGDPLSPALFAIVINAFSQSLKDGFRSGRIEGFSMPRHCHQVTHLAYADDIVIFTTTRKGSFGSCRAALTPSWQLPGCL